MSAARPRSSPGGEEFTAIGKPNLDTNLTTLRDDVDAALEAFEKGAPRTGAFANMSEHELQALHDAVHGQGIQIEIVTGPDTRIGAEGRHAATVIPQLRKDIQAVMGYDALVVPSSGRPEAIDQQFVEEALAAKRKSTP